MVTQAERLGEIRVHFCILEHSGMSCWVWQSGVNLKIIKTVGKLPTQNLLPLEEREEPAYSHAVITTC